MSLSASDDISNCVNATIEAFSPIILDETAIDVVTAQTAKWSIIRPPTLGHYDTHTMYKVMNTAFVNLVGGSLTSKYDDSMNKIVYYGNIELCRMTTVSKALYDSAIEIWMALRTSDKIHRDTLFVSTNMIAIFNDTLLEVSRMKTWWLKFRGTQLRTSMLPIQTLPHDVLETTVALHKTFISMGYQINGQIALISELNSGNTLYGSYVDSTIPYMTIYASDISPLLHSVDYAVADKAFTRNYDLVPAWTVFIGKFKIARFVTAKASVATTAIQSIILQNMETPYGVSPLIDLYYTVFR